MAIILTKFNFGNVLYGVYFNWSDFSYSIKKFTVIYISKNDIGEIFYSGDDTPDFIESSCFLNKDEALDFIESSYFPYKDEA